MIRLLIIFSIFIFLFLPTCYNFGNIVLKKIKLDFNKYLKIFVGAFSLIALFQIAYYPAMTLQLSSTYLMIVGTIICIFLLIIDIINIKEFINIYKDKYILFGLFISCIIFFIYIRTMPYDFWGFDDSFYLPFMYENSNTTKLLSVQPRTGQSINKLINIYATQGYYMIGSFLIGIYNILKPILDLKFNYVSIVYYLIAFPTFFMLVNLCIGMAKEICNKKWQKYLFICLFIFFSVTLPIDCNLLNNLFMTGYIGPFVSLTLYVPFTLFSMFKYFNGNRNYAKLLCILFFALLSIASFNIFLILILLYTLIFLQILFKKKKYLNDYMILAFPLLIFLSDFVIQSNGLAFIMEIFVIILYILYFIFNKYILKIEKQVIKILEIVVYTLPILVFLMSLVMITLQVSVSTTTYEYIESLLNTFIPLFGTLAFHYSYFVVTIFYLVYLIIWIYAYKNKDNKIKPILYYYLVISLVFLNPVCISFVSTYITSQTYNRLFILLFNPYIVYLVVSYVLKKINFIRIKNISKQKIIIILSVLFSLLIILIAIKEFSYWVARNGRSNKLYRMRDRDVIAEKRLIDFVYENNIKTINMATNHSEIKIINPKVNLLYDRTVKFEPTEKFTKKAYYMSTLYNLNKGIIKQEYYKNYKENDLISIIKYMNINFITIDVDCPSVEKNYTANVLCEKPKKYKNNPLSYDEELLDYKEDKKIYKELLKHLELVYQTDRYKIYYVKKR